MEADNNGRRAYIFTGKDRRGIPRDTTRVIVDKSVKVILDSEEAFAHCRDGVGRIAQEAFFACPSLRGVKMPGVQEIGWEAFFYLGPGLCCTYDTCAEVCCKKVWPWLPHQPGLVSIQSTKSTPSTRRHATEIHPYTTTHNKMSNPLPDTKQPASPPDDGLLGDVEMEDQQNNAAATATDAVDATTATLNNSCHIHPLRKVLSK